MRYGIFGTAVRCFLLAALCARAAWAATPSPTPTPTPAAEPSMRFIHAVGQADICKPDCPEWISAEGKIEIGTAAEFARFVNALGGRRLPVLIQSGGGSANDAMAMGRLIRARRMAVAVARSFVSPCPDGAKACATQQGFAGSAAYCASACPLVLAGGIERYVAPYARVGIHQVTLGQKNWVRHIIQVRYQVVDGVKREVSRAPLRDERFTTAPTAADLSNVDGVIAAYLREMGVGDQIAKLMVATPPSGIHTLTKDEIEASHMATQRILRANPVAMGLELSGLQGEPMAAGAASLLWGGASWPVLAPVDGGAKTLRLDIRTWRGGGTVELAAALYGADGATVPSPRKGVFTLYGPKGLTVRLAEGGKTAQASAQVPLRKLCALRAAKHVVMGYAPNEPAEQSDEGARRRETLAVLTLAAADGPGTALDEACTGFVEPGK